MFQSLHHHQLNVEMIRMVLEELRKLPDNASSEKYSKFKDQFNLHSDSAKNELITRFECVYSKKCDNRDCDKICRLCDHHRAML